MGCGHSRTFVPARSDSSGKSFFGLVLCFRIGERLKESHLAFLEEQDWFAASPGLDSRKRRPSFRGEQPLVVRDAKRYSSTILRAASNISESDKRHNVY